MKIKKLLPVLNLLMTLSVFLLGNSMTPRPGGSSGNGNPAILLMIPLFVLFVALVIQWAMLFRKTKWRTRTKTAAICLLCIHLTAGIYVQVIRYRNYRDFLAEVYENKIGYKDWDYIDRITSAFSIHINNQIYNLNTYFLFVSLSLLIWLLSSMIRFGRPAATGGHMPRTREQPENHFWR